VLSGGLGGRFKRGRAIHIQTNVDSGKRTKLKSLYYHWVEKGGDVFDVFSTKISPQSEGSPPSNENYETRHEQKDIVRELGPEEGMDWYEFYDQLLRRWGWGNS